MAERKFDVDGLWSLRLFEVAVMNSLISLERAQLRGVAE